MSPPFLPLSSSIDLCLFQPAYSHPPSIFSLRALDYHVISDEEIVENLHVGGRFSALSPHFHVQLYRKLPTVRAHEPAHTSPGLTMGSSRTFQTIRISAFND